jgi:hypothetical protein
MDKSKAIEYAKPFFTTWPKVDTFYITTDGQAFFSDQDAQAHAAGTRKDKTVITVLRQDIADPAPTGEGVEPKASAK